MCTVFWDRKRLLLVEFLHQVSTINPGFYCDTLKKLRRAIQNKRRGMLSRDVVMLRDNAHPHTLPPQRKFSLRHLTGNNSIIPPYSPDLAPSDLSVFLHLKSFLGGRRLHDDNEAKEIV
jgi:hypothetical protein